MNLMGKSPPGLKVQTDGKDPEYLAMVHTLPCIICQEWRLPQLSPTQAHHCIHGRYGKRKTPDRMAIPLCEGHHQGLMDTSKVAVHREPDKWKALYGQDTDWVAPTQDRIANMEKAL